MPINISPIAGLSLPSLSLTTAQNTGELNHSTRTQAGIMERLVDTPASKPFEQTLLGMLPTELLQIVTQCLSNSDLITIALISSKLRALAKRRLCRDISLPHITTELVQKQGTGMEHWPLCRTLSHRPDLAAKVFTMYIVDQDILHEVPVPSTQVLPDQLYLSPDFCAYIPQAFVTGMLLQRATKLEDLTLILLNYSNPQLEWTKRNSDGELEVYSLENYDPLLSQSDATAVSWIRRDNSTSCAPSTIAQRPVPELLRGRDTLGSPQKPEAAHPCVRTRMQLPARYGPAGGQPCSGGFDNHIPLIRSQPWCDFEHCSWGFSGAFPIFGMHIFGYAGLSLRRCAHGY
jgi:hypothetical protein